MGQVVLSGTLVAGPPQSSSSSFSAGIATYSISNLNGSAGFQRASGIIQRNETFVALTDLGEPGSAVKKASFFYFKSDSPVDLRLTRGDGAGGTVVETAASVHGLLIREFPSGKELAKVELLGTANFEYFVSGNQ
jgi:hypothetical protein